ncbi:hemogen [Athene noctua]|uniref:hemogen n=1 Tax=Athene noctua TaxID=126797 RepID=UPI003EBE2CBE
MEQSGETSASSNPSVEPSEVNVEQTQPVNINTYFLRDRKMLQKRKAEAWEKDSMVCSQRKQKKDQKKCRGPKPKQSCQPLVESCPEKKLDLDPQPNLQKEDEPSASKSAVADPVHQGSILASQDGIIGMQLGAMEGKVAASVQYSKDEEEVMKPAEAETPEALKILPEYDHQDNE